MRNGVKSVSGPEHIARVRSEDVQRFEGALSRYDEEKTVAILIASSASRCLCMQRYGKDIFTDKIIRIQYHSNG